MEDCRCGGKAVSENEGSKWFICCSNDCGRQTKLYVELFEAKESWVTVSKWSRNKLHESKKEAKGLRKGTFWLPSQCYDETAELLHVVTELFLEKGEFHKDVFPSMYRDFKTGVMGNKSVKELKEAKEKKDV